jgi:hypothetical protein
MLIHRTLAAAIFLAIGSAASVPTIALADGVAIGTKHHYVYFGDHQIYYAPDTKVYYWQHEGRWESGAAVPSEYSTYVTSGGVDLDLDTERPYERHEWVVKHYRDRHDDDRRDRDHDHR